jgi:hypothetical protein
MVEVVLAGYVFYRIKVQPSLAPPEKTEFDLATTAPVGAVLTTEELDLDDPLVVVPEPYPPMPEADMPAAEAPPMKAAHDEMPAAEGEILPPEDDKP